MIIDILQKHDNVELSYVDDDGSVVVDKVYIDNYTDIVVTDNSDDNKLDYLQSFKGDPVKKIQSKKFSTFGLQEFINHDLKNINIDLHSKIKKLNIPKIFSFDIETEITREFGYSTPEKAENRILSISITNSNLVSILFILKNPKVDVSKFDEDITQKGYVRNILQESLGDYYNEELEFQLMEFDDEVLMLEKFLSCIRDYFHLLIGWNSFDFDWTYILNRCKKLGIDTSKASPSGKLSEPKSSKNLALEIPVKYPQHRLLMDYMKIFKASLSYNNFESYSLNNVASEILNLEKVEYEGNLNTLYNEDYLKFIAYAYVDTLLVMLLHKTTNLINIFFFQSYYTSVPFLKLSQNTISMALIYNELRKKNIFMCTSEFTNNQFREYKGAFVKNPTSKNSKGSSGLDFKSLYPNSMISYYLSIDNKVNDTISMKNGKPINQYNTEKFEQYKKDGFCITPLGRIYKKNDNNLITSIEQGLLDEREIYKDYKNDIYLNILPFLEDKGNRPLKDNRKYFDEFSKDYNDLIEKCLNVDDNTDFEHIKKHANDVMEFYNTLQLTIKDNANSLYGSLGNQYFPLKDCDIAEDITNTGKHTAIIVDVAINKFFTNWDNEENLKLIQTFYPKVTKLSKFNYLPDSVGDICIYGDTDSRYIDVSKIYDLINVPFPENNDEGNKELINFSIFINEKFLSNIIDNAIKEDLEYYNGRYGHLKMAHEIVTRKSVLIKKKCYIMSVIWKDGKILKTPLLKYMGISLKRGETSKDMKKLLYKVAEKYIIDEYSEINIKNEINKLTRYLKSKKDIKMLSKSTSVSGISDMKFENGKYNIDKNHLQAQLMQNWANFIIDNKLEDRYQNAFEKQKMIYYKTLNHEYKYFGVPDDVDISKIGNIPNPDLDFMIDEVFIKPIMKIVSPSEYSATDTISKKLNF